MNRLHPYSAILLAFLTGSAFLAAALVAGPFPSARGDLPKGKAPGDKEKLIILADDGAARRQASLQLQYGMAARWTEGAPNGRVLNGEQLFPPAAFPPGTLSLPAKPDRTAARAGGPPGEGDASPFPVALAETTELRQARRFKAYVERHAARFRIKPNLVFAIMKAESNFDALAVSTASAQGLMQLVPTTGGRAAYKMVYGKDLVPSREYLQDPEKNIELGTAYLRHLAEMYFNAVESPDSRDYCLIAAYNTGPGNVYRAFGGDYDRAMACINSLSPPEVFDHLRRNLPYEETRNYLAKVVSSRREFFDL